MAFAELQRVRLLRPVDAVGMTDDRAYMVPTGTIGTVVTAHDDSCDVEFAFRLDDQYYDYAIVTLGRADVQVIC